MVLVVVVVVVVEVVVVEVVVEVVVVVVVIPPLQFVLDSSPLRLRGYLKSRWNKYVVYASVPYAYTYAYTTYSHLLLPIHLYGLLRIGSGCSVINSFSIQNFIYPRAGKSSFSVSVQRA